MRILCINGYVWPYHILCECETTFAVEFPTDLSAKREYSYKTIDGISVPEGRPLKYFTTCPACGKEHPIAADFLPKVIKERVKNVTPTPYL